MGKRWYKKELNGYYETSDEQVEMIKLYQSQGYTEDYKAVGRNNDGEKVNKKVEKFWAIIPLYLLSWTFALTDCNSTGYYEELSCSDTENIIFIIFIPVLLHIVWRVFHSIGVSLNAWDEDTGFFQIVFLTLLVLFLLYIYFRYIPKFNYGW
jgi:hypothetical protein